MEVLEREKGRERERVGQKNEEEEEEPVKTRDHGLGRVTTGRGFHHGLTVVTSVQAPASCLFFYLFFFLIMKTKKRKVHETWVASQEALLLRSLA